MFKLIDNNNPHVVYGHSNNTNFVELLKSKWDNLHENTDVFRYKIGNLQERLEDGMYLLQLNPDRGTKRRTPEQIDCIRQPFDPNKFNFTKVSPAEVLFHLVEGDDDSNRNKHAIIANISPISRYHTLLCPSLAECLPQVATENSIALALEVMFLAKDRDLRIAFNSLCALASVNHLHYHLLFENHNLPVETAKRKLLKDPVYLLYDYPVPAFCLEVSNQEQIKAVASNTFKLLAYFIDNSIAHNLMMTRGKSVTGDEVICVLIWPRKSSAGVKQFTAFNVAALELSGWCPVYNSEDYTNLRTEDLEKELSKWKLDSFDKLCEEVICLFTIDEVCKYKSERFKH